MDYSLGLRSLAVKRGSVSGSLVRESNFELLRIVAMLMILTGHVFNHGLHYTLFNGERAFGMQALFVCGVNLFFLISGWFGIRFSLRSLIKLLTLTFFFSALNLIGLWIAGVEMGSWDVVKIFLFPVSKSRYWFIMVYMAMIILSPMLNAALKAMSKRTFNRFLLLFTLFNLYSCGLGFNYVNVNGYTIIQAVWLYFVAHWLHDNESLFNRVGSGWYLALFVFFSVITAVMIYVTHRYEWMNYNAPLVVFSSVFLFLYFSRLNLRSVGINRVAACAFGCYLLQDGRFGENFLYGFMRTAYVNIVHNNSLVDAFVKYSGLFVATILIIWIASAIFTPVANRLADLLTGLVDRIRKRFDYAK